MISDKTYKVCFLLFYQTNIFAEVSCTACENDDEQEEYGLNNNLVNGTSELDDCFSENISEPVLKSPRIHTNGSRLAWDPAQHRSSECEKFYENCTKPVLSEPLTAVIHFCCEEAEKSERKRCRSLQWQGNCATGSPVSSPSECFGESPSKYDQNANDVEAFPDSVFRDDSSDGSLNTNQSCFNE